jgi:uroporphyrinogen-III synthase
VENVVRTATELRVGDAVLEAAARFVVGSIGPICSEALRRHGLPVDIEPEHPRMGHLVVAVARQARQLLARKRQAPSVPAG